MPSAPVDSTTNLTVDVAVVGAGLAGAAAVEKLAESGYRVAVVEARDRLGGRGYARPFAGGGDLLEFGGAWITPWQARIRDLCRRHGIALRPRSPFTDRRWYRDGALHRDGPSSAADRARHERTTARIAADAIALKLGHRADEKGRPIAGISFADYLDRLDPPQSTRDLLGAWWTVSGNADKNRAPAADLLHSSAYADGLTEAMAEVWQETLVGGVALLVERMLQAARVELLTAAPVTHLRHDAGGVEVTLADGRRIAAKAAVIATGLNPMRGIAFAPALGAAKTRAIATGHIGRAVKVWAKVRNVAVGAMATGGGTGIEWMFAERLAADGATLLVGFGVAADGWTPDIPADVERAVARFFPEATLLAVDWHDWNDDPFARGTWLGPIVGADAAYDAATWTREGRLAFATSDFAREDAGWFEAAIISGEDAAAEIAAHLGKS